MYMYLFSVENVGTVFCQRIKIRLTSPCICVEHSGLIVVALTEYSIGAELFLTFHIAITKTCLCNVYPLEPHFYIAKLGYAGVHLFFLFVLQNIDCGYSLEPPRRGSSNVYPQSMF